MIYTPKIDMTFKNTIAIFLPTTRICQLKGVTK